MTVALRRIALTTVALALLAPAPLFSGLPGLTAWMSTRLLGVPVTIIVGVVLLAALVLLAWAYARLSLDGETDRA